jgi:hypothetical protein
MSALSKANAGGASLTPTQVERVGRAYAELGSALKDAGVLAIEERPTPPVEPQWLKDTARQWRLLNDFAANHGGDLGRDAWGRLGRQHGYDPRGLGGFFVGSQPLMASQGERRVLTEHGRRFIERWRGDFGASEARPRP